MKAQEEKELRERLAALEDFHDKAVEDEIPTVFGLRLDQVGEIYDPYGIGNARPFSFKAHPEGFKLRWNREESRAKHGWKGWEPVDWDSDVGRNLMDYCYDPPRKLDNRIDSKVRRGDAILCILPAGQWLARQMARVNKAAANQAQHVTPEQDIIEEYKKGGVYGPGLTVSERPKQGFRMRAEEVSERSERAHGLLDESPAGHNSTEDNGEE